MKTKKNHHFLLKSGLLTAAAAGAALFLLFPEKPAKEKAAPFVGRNIAHRGLYTKDQSVPENSLPAFRRAVEHGYGVELDVHLVKDRKLVVLHDDTLERMTGAEGKVEDKTWRELRKLRLAGTEERMPLLEEVLEVIGGRVPIILEIKTGSRNEAQNEAVLAAISGYRGDLCIESFDPFIVGWWKKNAPQYLRGQLCMGVEDLQKTLKPALAWAGGHLFFDVIARPNFIAYDLTAKKPATVKLVEALGAMKVCWTSHDPSAEEENDTVIFEHYEPKVWF